MNCRKGIGEEGRREEGKGERRERRERKGREREREEGKGEREEREEGKGERKRRGGEREKIKVCMECSDHSTAVCLPRQPLLLGTGQFGGTEQWPQQLSSCRAVHLNRPLRSHFNGRSPRVQNLLRHLKLTVFSKIIIPIIITIMVPQICY